MDPALSSPAGRRAAAIARHLAGAVPGPPPPHAAALLGPSPCLSYAPPESTEPEPAFPPADLRALLDRHNLKDRDWVFRVMEESQLFCRTQRRGGGGGGSSRVFVAPDYNDGKEAQREATMRRVAHLARRGVFRGWLTEPGAEAELRKLALLECLGVYDHSLAIKIGVHFFLWYGSNCPSIFSSSHVLASITQLVVCFTISTLGVEESCGLLSPLTSAPHSVQMGTSCPLLSAL
jgi:acyl-CoA oxidase